MNEDFFECVQTITNNILSWYSEGYGAIEIVGEIKELLEDAFENITVDIDEQTIDDCSVQIAKTCIKWLEIDIPRQRQRGTDEEKIYHLSEIRVGSLVKNCLESYGIDGNV